MSYCHVVPLHLFLLVRAVLAHHKQIRLCGFAVTLRFTLARMEFVVHSFVAGTEEHLGCICWQRKDAGQTRAAGFFNRTESISGNGRRATGTHLHPWRATQPLSGVKVSKRPSVWSISRISAAKLRQVDE